MSKTTKVLSLFLAVIMVLSLLPTSVIMSAAESGKKITSVIFYDKNPDPRAEGEVKDYPAISVAYEDNGGSNDLDLFTLKEVANEEEAENTDFGIPGYHINGKWYKVVALWTVNPESDIIDKGAGHKVVFTPMYFGVGEKPAAGETIAVGIYDNVQRALSNVVELTMPAEGESTQVEVGSTHGTPVAKVATAAYVYDGKVKTPAVVVKDGAVTLKKGVDYNLIYQSGRKNAGVYKIKVTYIGDYKDATPQLIAFKIVKAKNTMVVKGKTVVVSHTKLKKARQVVARIKVLAIAKNQGSLVFAKAAGNKKITINKKTGSISVAKGLSKGVYKVKINVAATGNNNYNNVVKPVIVKIVVK